MIIANGQRYITLDDRIEVNGKRVVEVWANGMLAYPEGATVENYVAYQFRNRYIFFADKPYVDASEVTPSADYPMYGPDRQWFVTGYDKDEHLCVMWSSTDDQPYEINASITEQCIYRGHNKQYAAINKNGRINYPPSSGDNSNHKWLYGSYNYESYINSDHCIFNSTTKYVFKTQNGTVVATYSPSTGFVYLGEQQPIVARGTVKIPTL